MSLDCPPSSIAPFRRADGRPPTILDLAAVARDCANRYRRAIDDGADYRTVLRVSGMLARAADELTAAIADSVAADDGRITR